MQFLMNPDGTAPAGTNIAALAAAGILLVRPVTMPAPVPGMQVIEGDPELIDGIWYQTWLQLEIPTDPGPDPVPDITRWQFARFLATPPLRLALATGEPAAEVADPTLYADFQGYKQLDVHAFDDAVAMIAQFQPYFPEGMVMDTETLLPLWNEAVAF